jgi:hypothetical protein
MKSLNYLLIGAGGVASYFIPAFLKTFKPATVYLFDKDELEERNLDRQLFSKNQIGENKAKALASLHGSVINAVPDWFDYHKARQWADEGEDPIPDVIVCMADNHVARKNALKAADMFGSLCVLGGNEYFCSDAYAYLPRWEDTNIDPRIRYPEILTDESGNPMSCQGDEAMEAAPQLATANQTCASFLLNLIWAWVKTAPELAEVTDTETVERKVPVELSSNFNGITSKTVKDLMK